MANENALRPRIARFRRQGELAHKRKQYKKRARYFRSHDDIMLLMLRLASV
jgi:hypothetical protein